MSSRRPTVAEITRVLEIAGDMHWRQRFGLTHTANVVIVRLKDSASTSPACRKCHGAAGTPEPRRESGSPDAAVTSPAPTPAGVTCTPPCVASAGHHPNHNAVHRGLGGTTCP